MSTKESALNTDRTIDITCYECQQPFTAEEWQERHSQHGEHCTGGQTGEECACGERYDVHGRCCVDCAGGRHPELRAVERGHRFFPLERDLAQVPPLYGTEGQSFSERLVHLHYFAGAADWWVVELDPVSGLAFGYACLGDPELAEWGYISLPELEELYVPAASRQPGYLSPPVIVERDLGWQPKPVSDCGLPGHRGGQ